MARIETDELDLSGLVARHDHLPGEAAASGAISLKLRLTTGEIRALVRGSLLLGVQVSRLAAWAGTVNPDESSLPRWHRAFVDEGQLVNLCLMLDPDSLRVATVLAQRFDLDVETYLVARSFDWLRRIRDRHLDDERWRSLEVPAARTGWHVERTPSSTGLRPA